MLRVVLRGVLRVMLRLPLVLLRVDNGRKSVRRGGSRAIVSVAAVLLRWWRTGRHGFPLDQHVVGHCDGDREDNDTESRDEEANMASGGGCRLIAL